MHSLPVLVYEQARYWNVLYRHLSHLVHSQPLADVLGLDLGEGLRAHVRVRAGVVGGPSSTPLVAEVPVGVSTFRSLINLLIN